jgi:hypothetical protein
VAPLGDLARDMTAILHCLLCGLRRSIPAIVDPASALNIRQVNSAGWSRLESVFIDLGEVFDNHSCVRYGMTRLTSLDLTHKSNLGPGREIRFHYAAFCLQHNDFRQHAKHAESER